MPIYYAGQDARYGEHRAANGLRLQDALWQHFCGNNFYGTDMERAIEVRHCALSGEDLLFGVYEERADRELQYRFLGRTGKIRPEPAQPAGNGRPPAQA